MITERRFLPPIQSLLAFEAVARTGGVTAAAQELSLTQSAVSRQILGLEERLGVALFLREKKRLRLTPAGEDYAEEVRAALGQIARATFKLKANPTGGALNLAILPTFGTRWLAPRLGDFAQRHPEITVNLSTRLVPFDFGAEPFHAAIHYGDANWPGTEHLLLMTETVAPVCAPALLQDRPVREPSDLLERPLLTLQTRPNAWTQWLSAHGVEAPPPKGYIRGMVLDQFAAMAQAAIHGLGIALLPEFLIERELAEGRLVRLFDTPTRSLPARALPSRSLGAYYLVWPRSLAGHPPLQRFRAWLEETIVEEGIALDG